MKIKTTKIILLTMLISFGLNTMAQVAINNDGSSPDASAGLDVNFNDKGLLMPRLTNGERDAIGSPAEGLFIYNTDEHTIQFYNGTSWKYLYPDSCVPDQPTSITGNNYPDCNEIGVAYSTTEVSWAGRYNWTVPTNATITSGQGTTAITVNMGIQSGNVSVRAESGCGNSAYKDLPITISIPAQPSSIAGNILPEPNATGETYSIVAVNGATSYHWTIPWYATLESGQGTTSISIDFGTTTLGNVSVRAENTCGNSNYEHLSITLFTCGDQYTDTRNSQTYNTVSIGSQCWFAENLNIGTRIDGSVSQIQNSPTEIIEKYCYNDDNANCTTYGGLYQWDEIMQYVKTDGAQGICPDGWHLPTDDEWKTMEMALGMSQSQADATGLRGTDEGGKMKSTSGWYNSGNGTNSSGFTGLPAGGRLSSGSFLSLGYSGYWWSSTEISDSNEWYRWLYYNYDQVFRGGYDKTNGISVRCLKN